MSEALSLEALQQALSERTRDVRVLHRIIETVSSSLELSVVLEQILNLIVQVTEADACLIYLYDEDAQALTLAASNPSHEEEFGNLRLAVGEGLTGWVAKERQPLVLSEQAYNDKRFRAFTQLPEDQFEAFLSVPVWSGDTFVGIINVQHRSPVVYSQKTVGLVEAIGRMVGGAILNAQLYEVIAQQQKKLEAIAKVSDAVASESYLDEILQLIVTASAEVMGSKVCSLMLLDDSKKRLSIKATQALSEEYRNKPPIKVGESVSGRVVQFKKPITVFDVAKEKSYQYPEIAKKSGLKSLLSVPMMIKEEVVGVVNLYTTEARNFSDQEISTLATLANQAAVAIEHTRLIESSAKLRQTLEDRKVIEKAKGVLMDELKLPEAKAFQILQKQSMDRRKSLREIADAVLLAYDIKQ